MKRILISTAIYILGISLLQAQSADVLQGASTFTSNPSESSISIVHSQEARGIVTTPGTAGIFDIQFAAFLDSAVSASSGFVGVAWTGTEWWVSKFSKDSLFTLSPSGVLTSAFRIPGVGTTTSGVRSMTFDGTYLYMADNTSIIKKVDPITKALVSTINVSSIGFNARSITYCPASNNNAGGFWISNFGSPLVEVDLTGTVLTSIPQSIHTLVGVYGIAYDELSPGGPFLWAFDQTATGTQANLVRLQLPQGAPTFVNHNVNGDVGLLTPSGATAGGLFITDSFVPGEFTIAGVLQDTTCDILFAYELDSASQIANDLAVDSLRWQPAYTIIPDQQIVPFSFGVILGNKGANSLPAVGATASVFQGGSQLFSAATGTSSLSAGASVFLVPAQTWTPTSIGNYRVQMACNTGGVTDQNPFNDTASFSIVISDTVMARDNNVVNGALGIGNGITGILGQVFTLQTSDAITSVSFRVNTPTVGDTTRVVVYSVAGGLPSTLIGRSGFHIFSSAAAGWITLKVSNLAGGPLTLVPGTYYFGLEEYSDNVSLSTSNFNWRPNTTFISFPGASTQWATNESFGFRRVFLLRINSGNLTTGLEAAGNATYPVLFPNPGSDYLEIATERAVEEVFLMDASGKVLDRRVAGTSENHRLVTSKWADGSYLVRVVFKDGSIWQRPWIKTAGRD